MTAACTATGAGTLCAALDRLTRDGLVATEREEAVEGRLRRYYAISDEGRRRLAAEVAAARLRLAGGTA
ncbi:PadR family transcriptional regulator [Thermomonospora cellulosilytica]|uniref:DNA-binding PadR family transcriptional regulator n=1 Tax=Thermomonospora cellulosilytica TaxID=1411118 RepID=A0A7W3N2H1_9ACTN|nr:helix-turn-helix transcriptional regulator [Thermomonospora cellulosilytica]MBA9006297.1 DNA-binding PadR family transcriptional regulator [Thermomonospora cellulosilytica]